MTIPSLRSTYAPRLHIKLSERIDVDHTKLLGRNLVVTRDEEPVESKSLLYLGKILEHTPAPDLYLYDVWLDVGYPYVVLIPGRRGTGKSYTLGVFAEGLALTAKETKVASKELRHTILIFDTLGQFWQMGFKPVGRDSEEKRQLEELRQWGLSPVEVKNLQVFVPSGRAKAQEWHELKLRFCEIEPSELAGLLGVDLYQDRMGQLLYHVYAKVREEGYRSASIDESTGEITQTGYVSPKTDFDVKDLVSCIDSDYEVISPSVGYEVQTRRALRSRLVEISRWKIFAPKGTLIDEIFKEGHVNIVNLEGIDEDLRNLIVAVIVRKIFQARESTRREEKIREVGLEIPVGGISVPPGWVIIDEAHEFCPNLGRTAARDPLIRFAKEGRSLGLGLIMATQQPSALSEKISSQAEVVISHALAFAADIRSLNDRLVNKNVQEFHHKSGTVSFEEQIRLLPTGCAVISAIGIPRTFLMMIRPRITMHGGKAPRME